MAAPCRKCGATKTEPTARGLRHVLARALGYDLRRCARCRRLRVLPKARPGDQPYAARSHDPDGFSGCPRCGAMRYRRTRRWWLERLARRPPMACCENCACRFPVPQA